MGEPLATLPPQRARVAHGQARKAVGKLGQTGPLGGEPGKRLGQRHGGADGDVFRGVVDAAQLGGAGHVQHLGQLAVLLGHPQAYIGGASHHLRLGVGSAGGQQFGLGGGGDVSQIGLWRLWGKR